MKDLSELTLIECRRIIVPLFLFSLPLIWVATHLFRKFLFSKNSLDQESLVPLYTAAFAALAGSFFTLAIGDAQEQTRNFGFGCTAILVYSVLMKARVFETWKRIAFIVAASLPFALVIQQVTVGWATNFVP